MTCMNTCFRQVRKKSGVVSITISHRHFYACCFWGLPNCVIIIMCPFPRPGAPVFYSPILCCPIKYVFISTSFNAPAPLVGSITICLPLFSNFIRTGLFQEGIIKTPHTEMIPLLLEIFLSLISGICGCHFFLR